MPNHWHLLRIPIGKNNNTLTVQAEFSKFASLLFDQGFQLVIPPRSLASVPEPMGKPSNSMLHQSDCCLLCQLLIQWPVVISQLTWRKMSRLVSFVGTIISSNWRLSKYLFGARHGTLHSTVIETVAISERTLCC